MRLATISLKGGAYLVALATLAAPWQSKVLSGQATRAGRPCRHAQAWMCATA